MEIANKALSLFDFIGNHNKSNSLLEELGKGQREDIIGGIRVLESGVAAGNFEDTLKLLEKGEIDIDLTTVENYFQFNQNKLDKELAQLTKNFSLGAGTHITLQDGMLVVADTSENGQALQHYLDKDKRLNNLIEQTGKLSQFVEWGQAKQQAAVYKSNDVTEEELVDFLKNARKVVTEDNHLILLEKGSGFSSQGHTQALVEQLSEKNS